MTNQCTIVFEDLCLEINSKIRIPRWKRLSLVLTNVFTYAIVMAGFWAVAAKTQSVVMVIPFVGLLVFVFVTLTKYSLWKLSGQELVVIGTKNIEVFYDYGLYRPKPQTIPFRQLSTVIVPSGSENGIEVGRLNFFDHNELYVPEPLFETTINLPREDLEAIVRKLNVLFFIRDNQPIGNPRIILN